MQDDITIRPATLSDVPDIRTIHEGDDDPWADIATCAIWTNHRLLRGFLIEVAILDGEAVGHAEWIVSPEPEPIGVHLYLGVLQVRSDVRGLGIGRALVISGKSHAKQVGCSSMRTNPAVETADFYLKNGFLFERAVESIAIPVQGDKIDVGWRKLRSVSRRTCRTLPMRVGWYQGSSAHMWEVVNSWPPVYGDDINSASAAIRDQAVVQTYSFAGSERGSTVAWASRDIATTDLVRPILALGGRLGKSPVSICVPLPDSEEIQRHFDAVREEKFEIWRAPIHG